MWLGWLAELAQQSLRFRLLRRAKASGSNEQMFGEKEQVPPRAPSD
jgi:hypothetical protein